MLSSDLLGWRATKKKLQTQRPALTLPSYKQCPSLTCLAGELRSTRPPHTDLTTAHTPGAGGTEQLTAKPQTPSFNHQTRNLKPEPPEQQGRTTTNAYGTQTNTREREGVPGPPPHTPLPSHGLQAAARGQRAKSIENFVWSLG